MCAIFVGGKVVWKWRTATLANLSKLWGQSTLAD